MKRIAGHSPLQSLQASPKRRFTQPLSPVSQLGSLSRLPPELLSRVIVPLVLAQGSGPAFAQASSGTRSVTVQTACSILAHQVFRRGMQSTRSLQNDRTDIPEENDIFLQQADLFLRRFEHPQYHLEEWAEAQTAENGSRAFDAAARIRRTRKSRGQALDLNFLALHSLPNGLGIISWLSVLNLYDNHLTSLPSDLAKLTELEVLSLRNNNFTTLPSVVFSFKRLNTLDIAGNEVTALGDSFQHLKALTLLEASDNAIDTISDEVFRLPYLDDLELRNNRITALTQNIPHRSRLSHLGVAENSLTSLPPQIGQLLQLEDLDISGNYISDLPDALEGCISMSSLHLHNNRFSRIPSVITRLNDLVQLTIFHNPLSVQFPRNFAFLTQLRTLHIDSPQWRAVANLPRSLDDIDFIDLNEGSEFHTLSQLTRTHEHDQDTTL